MKGGGHFSRLSLGVSSQVPELSIRVCGGLHVMILTMISNAERPMTKERMTNAGMTNVDPAESRTTPHHTRRPPPPKKKELLKINDDSST